MKITSIILCIVITLIIGIVLGNTVIYPSKYFPIYGKYLCDEGTLGMPGGTIITPIKKTGTDSWLVTVYPPNTFS